MNFLFLPGGSTVGGMEVVVQGLMAGLNRIGHRTLALISGWNDGNYPARLGASGLSFEEIRLGRFYLSKPLWTLDTLRNLPEAALGLRRISNEFRPDFVIYPEPQLLLIGSSILPKARNVLYLHDKPGGILVSRFARIVNAHATRVACVSNFVADCLQQTPFDATKVGIVHNGIESPSIHSVSVESPSVRLGIVGQLIPMKQHLLLVEALHLLRNRALKIPYCLKIVGKKDGPYAQEVKERVARLDLRDVVEWVGFRSVRDDIYRNLDIVVAPAVDEPFGTTVLEAGAYGLPVVASRSGGFPEMMLNGKTGLFCDPGDVASLAGALEILITDAPLRVRLGRAAQKHISQTFTVERMASRFVEVVSGVPVRKRAPTASVPK